MIKNKFFESTVKLYECYRNKMKKEKNDGYNSDLSNEVWMRLHQLSFICKNIRLYEQKIRSTTIVNKTHKLAQEEGMVFVETFYFFAWRIICITKLLPYLKNLKKKSKGITIVRNHLIEHPEREYNILSPSCMWGSSNGPILKNARPTGQTFEIQDRGLWINAQEFKDGFEELLQNAIKNSQESSKRNS
jgi:hypothetical protein